MSEDPIGFAGDAFNLYRYVANSPTNATDPSGTITVTTIGRPENLMHTDPGGFDVNWRFRLDKPAPEEGYIVQRVTWVWNYVDKRGMPINQTLVYYEVWHVKKDWIKSDEEFKLGPDGETMTDNALENKKALSRGGTISQDGVIKFWTCDEFDPVKEGFKRNLVMPVPDATRPDGRPIPVTPAGPLLALQGTPGTDPAFWRKPSSNGEKTGVRGVQVAWPPHVVRVYP